MSFAFAAGLVFGAVCVLLLVVLHRWQRYERELARRVRDSRRAALTADEPVEEWRFPPPPAVDEWTPDAFRAAAEAE